MSSINRNRTVPRTPASGATTGPAATGSTSATTATTSTTPANATTATTADAPVPSAADSVSAVPKAVINGMAGLSSNQVTSNSANNRFAGDVQFHNLHADGDKAVGRGFIKMDAAAIPGGCRVTVNSFHKAKNDKLTLILQAEILDTSKNQLRTVNLAVLANNEVMNKDSFRGTRSFDISYADVNAFLQARNPNLKINPGTTSLAVAAKFNNSHNAGGPGRGGSFRTPLPVGQSATSTRIGNMVGATTEKTDLPLDMQVAFPSDLVAAYPMLKPEGNIVSRLESEYKGSTDHKKMAAAVAKMYDITDRIKQGDHSAAHSLLGPDWTIETVNRYWVKDDGSTTEGHKGTGKFAGFRVDDDGLPLQDPMHDQYMDDAKLSMTKEEGAIRLRKNAQATFINVKPGGGRIDDSTKIRQRVEVGVELQPDASNVEVKTFLGGVASNAKWANTVFNHAEKQVKKLDPNMKLANSLNPFLDVRQDRHKFTVKNERTGVEIELSFDFVTARTIRKEHGNLDGTPREVKYAVLEAELDHLQLQSANSSDFAAAGAQSGAFTTDTQQDNWLKGTSTGVTMDIDPRLHELEDLKNESFRATGSYRSFEKANAKLIPFLFPEGLGPAKQKAAHGSDLLAIVAQDTPGIQNRVKFVVEQYGLKWTSALADMVKTESEKPGGLDKLNQHCDRNSRAGSVTKFLKTVNNNQDVTGLEYDHAALKATVGSSLKGLGLQSSPEIDKLLEAVDMTKIQPDALRQQLNQLSRTDDAQMFAALATALGVTPAPVPVADAKALVASLPGKMGTSWLARSDLTVVNDLVDQAVKAGASALKIRGALTAFEKTPESTAKQLAALVPGSTVPVMHADKKRVIGEAAGRLSKNKIVMTTEVEDFLKALSKKAPRAEVISFVNSLARSDFKNYVKKAATKHGLTEPTFAFDRQRIVSDLTTATTNIGVSLDQPMQDFVIALLENGATFQKVQGFAQGLYNYTPDKALSRQRLTLPAGVTLPTVTWDKSMLETVLTNNTTNHPLKDRAELTQLALDVVAGGKHTMAQAVQAVAQFPRYKTPADAFKARNITVPDGVQLPAKANWDVDALLDYWKNSSSYLKNGKINAETETYLRAALPKVFAHADSTLNAIWNPRNVATLVKQVQTWSGDAPPTGVG